MPTANEVFQAAKRGQKVTHRNLGEATVSIDGYLMFVRTGGVLFWSETELDETAWTIEPLIEIKTLPTQAEMIEYLYRATLASNGENVK